MHVLCFHVIAAKNSTFNLTLCYILHLAQNKCNLLQFKVHSKIIIILYIILLIASIISPSKNFTSYLLPLTLYHHFFRGTLYHHLFTPYFSKNNCNRERLVFFSPSYLPLSLLKLHLQQDEVSALLWFTINQCTGVDLTSMDKRLFFFSLDRSQE